MFSRRSTGSFRLVTTAIVAFSLALPQMAFAASGTWNQTGGSNWNVNGNWSGATFPDGIDQVATLGNSITGNANVQMTTNLTLGTLNFDDNNNYTITQSTGTTITFDTTTANAAQLNVTSVNGSGTHSVSNTRIALNDDLTISVASGLNFTINSRIDENGSHKIIKSGTGTLTLTGSVGGNSSYSGGTTINASSGTLNATVNSGLNALGTGAVSVGANSTVVLNNTDTAANTTISNTFTGAGTVNLNLAAGGSARNTNLNNVTGVTGTISLTTSGATGDKWSIISGINAPGASVVVNNNAQLFVAAAATFEDISIIGTGNTETRGAIRLASTLNAPITLSGNATIGNEGGTINGGISAGTAGLKTLTMGTAASNGSATLNGALTDGAGQLALTTAFGTTTLTAASTYTGGTNISGSVLKVSAFQGTNNPLYRIDATQTSSLFQDTAGTTGVTAAGQSVALWKDATATGNNFSQATAANQPTYQTGVINGLSAIRFDGATDKLTLSTSVNAQTVFIINKPNGTLNSLDGIWGINNVDTGIRAAGTTSWQNPGNGNDFSNPGGSTMYVNGVAGNTFTANTAHLLEVVRGTSALTMATTSVGDYFSGGSRSYQGDIGEVIVFSSALSATDRQRVEAYLNYKWFGTGLGVGNLLPTTTPVTISNGGTLDLSGENYQTIGSLSSTDGLGSKVTLGAAALTVGNASNTTFDGVISGNGGRLIKTGSGTLTLTGANAHTGLTTVSTGTVIAQNNAAFGGTGTGTTVSSGATIDLGGTLAADTLNLGAEVLTISGTGVGGNGALVNNSANQQINAVQKVVLAADASIGGTTRWDVRGAGSTVSGNFDLTKTGANTIALVTTAVSVKNININQGQLAIQAGANVDNTNAGTITINAGGTLNVGDFGSAITISKPIVFNGGTFTTSSTGANGNATIAATVTQTTNGVYTPQATSALVLGGAISGAGQMNMNGAGTLQVNAGYTGSTVNVNTGTLALNGGGDSFNPSTKQINIANGATLKYLASNVVQNNVLITVATGGTLDMNGQSDAIGQLAGGGNITNNGGITLDGFSNPSTQDFSGSIGGTGGITLRNITGTQILSGTNSYGGTTTVSNGTLRITGTPSLPGSAVVNSPGVLQLVSNSTTWGNTVTGTGTVQLEFSAAAGNTSLNNITGFNGTVELTKSSATTGDKWNINGVNAPNASVIVNSGTQLFPNTAAVTLEEVSIIGTGNTETRGALRLSTTLNAPIKVMGNATIGAEGGVINGAISTSVAGTSTLTLGTTNSNTFATNMLNGVVSDGTGTLALAVFNQNSGSVFISGASLNTYSGGTTLLNSSSGTRLVIGSITGTPYGSGPITIGSVNTDKAGIYFITANQTLTNAIVFNTELGTDRPGVRADATNITLSGQITANNSNALFSTTGTGSLKLTGKITGTNGLTLDNAFGTTITVTLDNVAENNDYAGTTRVESGAGVLVLGRNNQIPNGVGKGNVQLDGTLNLNGFSDTINGLAGAGTLDGVSGTPTFTVGDGNATGSNFSGIIKNTAGSLALVKTGTGDQTLSGANTYSGGTQVNAGRLAISGAGTFGTGAVTVASGAQVYLTSGTHNNVFNLSGDGGNGLDTEPRGAIRFEGGNLGASSSVVLQADASLGAYFNTTGTVGGVISESGGARALSINKSSASSPGTIVLGAANTFSGDTRIYNGTLRLNNILALQNSTVDMNAADAGALSFGTLTSATFGGLMGSRSLSLNNTTPTAVALSVGNNNQSTTYSGALSGGGSLTKIGTGTLTLTGANTYTGVTNITGGTLQFDAGGTSTGTSAINVGTAAGSGTLLLTSNVNHTLGGAGADVVVGSGGNQGTVLVQINGVKVILPDDLRTGDTISGTVSHTGTGELEVQGTVTLGDGAGSFGHYIISAGTLTTPDLILGQGVGSSGQVTQTGGTINVTATNTYSVGAGGGSATVNQSGGVTNVTGNMIIGDGSGLATENQYNLSGGVLDFGDSAGVSSHWDTTNTGTAPSTLTINTDGQFNFTGGTLRDVKDIATNGGTFVQNNTDGASSFYIGQDEGAGGYALETTINGGYSLLGGTLYIDVFGDDLTPEQCCDNVASNNDQLTVSGLAYLNDTISLNYVGGYEPEFGDIFTLICADDITLGSGFHIDGGFFRLVPSTGDPNGPMALQAIVPEPASIAVWTLVGLAGAAGAWRSRKRLACRQVA